MRSSFAQSSAAAAVVFMLGGCGRGGSGTTLDAGAGAAARSAVTAVPVTASSGVTEGGAPRQGMVWVGPGTLLAGTPPDRTPRVADEEMAGVAVEFGGFYIDLLPWPNEPNAIPTSNVTRDDAEQLCVGKGKRLCTELEWERACKGPDNHPYEYGDAYRKEVCGTGDPIEQASRRPTGEHAQCKSGFGVTEMHGGVFEWTSSSWGRESKDASQGVLRGGNSVAGELAGRCANAIARAPSKKAPTMGFRCCAGTTNVAEVKLELRGTPGLGLAHAAALGKLTAALATVVGSPSIDKKSLRGWSWVPVANEELVIAAGCSEAPRACGMVVARPVADNDAGAPSVLGSAPSGRDPPEVARVGDARHLRIRALDNLGVFGRDVTYAYGRVEIGEPKRR